MCQVNRFPPTLRSSGTRKETKLKNQRLVGALIVVLAVLVRFPLEWLRVTEVWIAGFQLAIFFCALMVEGPHPSDAPLLPPLRQRIRSARHWTLALLDSLYYASVVGIMWSLGSFVQMARGKNPYDWKYLVLFLTCTGMILLVLWAAKKVQQHIRGHGC